MERVERDIPTSVSPTIEQALHYRGKESQRRRERAKVTQMVIVAAETVVQEFPEKGSEGIEEALGSKTELYRTFRAHPVFAKILGRNVELGLEIEVSVCPRFSNPDFVSRYEQVRFAVREVGKEEWASVFNIGRQTRPIIGRATQTRAYGSSSTMTDEHLNQAIVLLDFMAGALSDTSL